MCLYDRRQNIVKKGWALKRPKTFSDVHFNDFRAATG